MATFHATYAKLAPARQVPGRDEWQLGLFTVNTEGEDHNIPVIVSGPARQAALVVGFSDSDWEQLSLCRLKESLAKGSEPQTVTLEISDQASLQSLRNKEKECRWLDSSRADRECTATKLGESRATTKPACAACAMPDSTFLCADLTHPMNFYSLAIGKPLARIPGPAQCNGGHRPGGGEKCFIGGLPCWRMQIEQRKPDPAQVSRQHVQSDVTSNVRIGADPKLSVIDYDVEDEPHDQGSDADVFKVKDRGLDRELAVKLMRGTDDPSAIVNQGIFLAKINSPNVVPVHHLARVRFPSGRQAIGIAMELLGEKLNRALHAESNAVVLLHWAKGVASGVRDMHAAGVAHGDLHDGNVLISLSGDAKIIDVDRIERQINKSTRTVDSLIAKDVADAATLVWAVARRMGLPAKAMEDLYDRQRKAGTILDVLSLVEFLEGEFRSAQPSGLAQTQSSGEFDKLQKLAVPATVRARVHIKSKVVVYTLESQNEAFDRRLEETGRKSLGAVPQRGYRPRPSDQDVEANVIKYTDSEFVLEFQPGSHKLVVPKSLILTVWPLGDNLPTAIQLGMTLVVYADGSTAPALRDT